MTATINETLEYILFLTRHIPKGNIRAASLALLMELGFPENTEGFGYLRAAIIIRVGKAYLRFSTIYQKVAEMQGPGISDRQVEQDIRETDELLVKGLSDEDKKLLHHYLDIMIQNLVGEAEKHI